MEVFFFAFVNVLYAISRCRSENIYWLPQHSMVHSMNNSFHRIMCTFWRNQKEQRNIEKKNIMNVLGLMKS